MKRAKNFTLLEIVLVVTIIAIFAGALLPVIQGHYQTTTMTKFYELVETVKKACQLYYADTGLFAVEVIQRPGWEDRYYGLTRNDGRSPDWRGPYINRPITSKDNPCRQDWSIGVTGYNPPWSITPGNFDLDGNGTEDTTGPLNTLSVDGCSETLAKTINDRFDASVLGDWQRTGRVRNNGAVVWIYLTGGTGN